MELLLLKLTEKFCHQFMHGDCGAFVRILTLSILYIYFDLNSECMKKKTCLKYYCVPGTMLSSGNINT